MKKKTAAFLLAMLLCLVQGAWAWDGSGTASDPYLIKNDMDWLVLVTNTRNGTSYKGKVFRLATDLNITARAVGTEDNPFAGTFDGDGHTLTVVDSTGLHQLTAPFRFVQGATIRHLRTTGYVTTSQQYAAGIVSLVKGTEVTAIEDCRSDMDIYDTNIGNAAHGGLVGAVASGGLTMDRCEFTGYFTGGNSAGLVGWSNVDVTITNSIVSPATRIFSQGGRTFARMAGGAKLTLQDCYYTMEISPNSEAPQGVAIFKDMSLPEGCTYEMQGEPDLQFGGEGYWKNGAYVRLTVPEGVAFDHWDTGINGCFISDPWIKDGLHRVLDVHGTPTLSIATSVPEGEERTMDGTRYRYLRKDDYHLYVSDEDCKAKGWEMKDGYLQKYVSDKDAWAYITAVVGWVAGKIPSDGLQIHNDLAGDWHEHTLTGLIAPRAFMGCTELKTVYFKDTDATHKNQLQKFDFFIGDRAFADCPNLTEVKMMQYTTEGSNHWEYISPEQVSYVYANAFDGSPNALITCHREVYQRYMGSETWRNFRSRISVYDATVQDFNIDGVKYHSYRDKTETRELSSNDKQEMLDNHVAIWAADYQQFVPSSLLALTDESQKVWYTSVVGVDDSYLDSHDGKMVILNDLGTYHNYKTICLNRSALAGNEHVKSIEFRQVNGNQTSRSDLKMVIQNGALKGCKNLKELRLFYFCEDGDDHWETLGPQDVIPGDNIFGEPTEEELETMTEEEYNNFVSPLPDNFKILASPSRIQEFLDDPNWQPYTTWIEAVDFDPTNAKDDFTMSEQPGITYGYVTTDGGVLETSQTVSQDVSWWTAPRIIAEIVYELLTMGSGSANPTDKTLATEIVQTTGKLQQLKLLKEEMTQFIHKKIDTCLEDVCKLFGGKTTDELLVDPLTEEGAFFLLMLNNAGALAGEGYQIGGTILEPELLMTEVPEFKLFSLSFWTRSYYDKAITSVGKKLAELKARQAVILAKNSLRAKLINLAGTTAINRSALTTSSILAAKQWGGNGSYNGDQLQKGMRENILSNIHQVGVVGGGYVITTPVKNIAYHTYIKEVSDDVTRAVIYAGTDKGQGGNANTVTTTFAKNAFRNHKNLTHIEFFENNVTTNEAVPMVLTIPDSAFVGCDNLQELRLLLKTDGNGTQAMGPESFVLGGDSIFAGLSPKKFHIVIDPSRKQDFLDNKSWAPLEKYFRYEAAQPDVVDNHYGAKYAYVYENGSVQKVHKEQGHKIEHTIVTGATTESGEYHLDKHQGALKLCNDIGVYNNYQLDAVQRGAFKGNKDLRVVNFTDLWGTGAFGNSYTDLSLTLQDSCFANCKNLTDVDLLYLVTDEDNHIDPITPQQLMLGKDVFSGSPVRLKMMPQQVAWFEADTTWNKYRDLFTPCIIKPGDEGVKAALKPMAYYDKAAQGYDPDYWTDYIDLTRIAEKGFSWLNGKFHGNKDIRSFGDFQYFSSVGLDYVGSEWFKNCTQLSNIALPQTIRRIEGAAFEGCTALTEIELPESVRFISRRSFLGCSALKSIVVHGKTPAKTESTPFPYNDGMKIYVPTASVSAYKKEWPDYAQYIVGMDSYNSRKVVNVSTPGTLAQELGLSWEWSYSGVAGGDEPRYLTGHYSGIDSLTVSGLLNNVDLATLRYLAGCDSYTRGGAATDGRLRYLNMKDVTIHYDKNDKAHYLNLSYGLSSEWYEIVYNNVLPKYLFYNCTSLETVILPSNLSRIDNFIFLGCSALKRVAVTGRVKQYANWENVIGELGYPLEELVFLTDTVVVSEDNDPWGQPIQQVFTKKSQFSDYQGHPYLTNQAQNITALFEDDAVMESLAKKGEYFPSEYLMRENVDDLFRGNEDIRLFDDFYYFQNVKELERTFENTYIESITLPTSIKRIGADAFSACYGLKTISLSCDTVPELGENAFRDLPEDFQILVPKNLCKLYRTKWPQYASHINPDMKSYADADILVVTTTAPNTLAKELGLTVTTDRSIVQSSNWERMEYINSVRGDYSDIKRLKVVGPISGADLSLLRYLAGFCPWANTRNYFGQLEYIDLYDAELKASNFCVASDMLWDPRTYFAGHLDVAADNELPSYSFLQAYALKTLILPRTLTKIETRALQQCEALETLVIGDETTDINWSALDDDVMLSRLYLLSKQKPQLDMDSWMWRNLCNNYHPTFDAFYVRPSLYEQYLYDEAYTGLTWQRTNSVSKGEFDEDDSFCAFAAHAAATQDDLLGVDKVDGWFKGHEGIRDLTPLRYTLVDSLSAATMQPLTKLEKIALPMTMDGIEEGAFAKATKLRYVDMLLCDSTDIAVRLRDGGLKRIGIDSLRTLVYLPKEYGEPAGTNVIVNSGTGLKAETYRLVDSLDYCVPYAFEAARIENSRILAKDAVPYTVCLPYALAVPLYSRAYKLAERDGSTLTFVELEKGEKMEALQPYLVKVVGNKRFRKNSSTLNTTTAQTIPASGAATYGQQVDMAGYALRGTLEAIDNQTAAEMGAYLLQSDGDWHPVASGTEKEKRAAVRAFRAYLLQSAHGAGTRLAMKLIDNDPTGVETIETIDLDGTRRYYDLQGRELPGKPDKGVYIYNGKKYFNK